MEWDRKRIKELHLLFSEKYFKMRGMAKTDRRNFSAIWNKYLSRYNAEVLVNFRGKGDSVHVAHTLANIIEIVNMRNEWVAGSLVIANPDRNGQYILVPRDMAERIMVLGLI